MSVVIGETAVLGDDVMLYQGVTLGSKGWWTDGDRVAKRHPTIGDRVILGANASVLGPISVGHDSVIGAHSLVLQDVVAHSTVRAAASVASVPVTAEPGAKALEYCI